MFWSSHGRTDLRSGRRETSEESSGDTGQEDDLESRHLCGVVRQLSSGRFSLKMSPTGQVFLVTVENFFEGLRIHYQVDSTPNVKYCLGLFIGSNPSLVLEFMSRHDLKGTLHKSGILLEQHQSRLVAATLATHLPNEWQETISWMQFNIGEITDLCFARGMAAKPSDWATHLWYYITDQSPQIDQVIPISDLVAAAVKKSAIVSAGPNNGGSTITLPFGFLQMHQSQMQFHHRHDAIATSLRN